MDQQLSDVSSKTYHKARAHHFTLGTPTTPTGSSEASVAQTFPSAIYHPRYGWYPGGGAMGLQIVGM